MSEFEFIRVGVEDGIARVTLDRPPVNVMHGLMMAELNAALRPLVSDDGLAAIVFDAAGKAFCAGVDIADHTEDNTEAMIHEFHGIFRKLASTDALTIAAVGRAALGGGCELACFCDIVLASDRAKFGQPEVQVGVFPPVAAAVLPLQIGIRAAVEFTALGETIDANEALRLGLASHVYEAEKFDDEVAQYVERIRKLSRPVVRLAKRATTLVAREQVLAHLDRAESLYLEDLMKVADAHEGIAAFMEKREPAWQHA